jgi:hypothetical protein
LGIIGFRCQVSGVSGAGVREELVWYKSKIFLVSWHRLKMLGERFLTATNVVWHIPRIVSASLEKQRDASISYFELMRFYTKLMVLIAAGPDT